MKLADNIDLFAENDISEKFGDSLQMADKISTDIVPAEVSGIKPEFLRLPRSGKLCPITGLSRSKFNELVLPCKFNNFRPPVESIVLRSPGRSRGVRLISYASAISFLKSQNRIEHVIALNEKFGETAFEVDEPPVRRTKDGRRIRE